jgi:glycosyltransferase involved in cell wall biosynthesis
MHGSVLGFFAYGALQNAEVAGKDVLEVGSLDVNGSVRPMVMARQPASYMGVDVVDGPGVDRVVDAVDLVATFGPDSFDVVVSTEMLEHAADWQAAVANMVAVLRPGGVLVWTTRSPGFAYHHPPDRWRFTQQAMAEVLARLELEPLVLMDDPEHPGVFCKTRKLTGWRAWWPTRDVPHPLKGVKGVTPVAEPLNWLGLPCNPDGTGYYRFWQPWAQLAKRSGHTVAIPPPGQHRIIPGDEQVEQIDLLAQQRPGGRQTLRDWRRWKGIRGAKLVYETDDHLLGPDSSELPDWLATEVAETVTGCLKLADLVTTSTEPLAEVLREHNPNVVVIPDCIHEDLLAVQRPRPERVTVGWAGGGTHAQDIAMVQDTLNAFLDAHYPRVDLHLMGIDHRPWLRRRGRWSKWQENIWDYYRAIDFDVALAPLVDTAFNRTRAPIKALEMAALGIPVVASDLEPYREIVVDGVTGFLCRTEADWYGRIRDLAHDEAMREELGAKAKEVAREHTIQQGWSRWAAAYEEVCT